MSWRERISVSADVCHGQACIKGTRVLVSVILDSLADDETPASVAASYRITVEDVHAALEYAAELAKDRVVSFRGTSAA